MHNCLKGTDEFPGLQQLCVRVLGCAPSLPKGGYRILASLMYACRTPPLVTSRASRFVSFRPVRGRLWAVEFKLKTSRWLESCGSLTPRAVEARDKARHLARLSGLVTPFPKAGSILIASYSCTVRGRSEPRLGMHRHRGGAKASVSPLSKFFRQRRGKGFNGSGSV